MEIALGIIAGVLLVDMVFSHFWLRGGINRPPPTRVTPERWPSVSVVRPVKGADAGQVENFRAALESDYAGEVETIFIFDGEDDPGYANAARVVEEHVASGRRGTARVMTAGEPPERRTGKLHAMIVGGEAARGELLAFGDSDTRPTPGLLTDLVATLLADEKTGCTFAPAIVTSELRTAGDVGYATLLNSMYGSAAARAAGRSGRLSFIMGQVMVFRREALEDVGGVACAEGQLVDDMAIGRCLHAAGWRNVMVKTVLPIIIDRVAMGEFLKLYRKWMLFGRNGLSRGFTWP
ncbi:MAG: glycosyltransferase family 2 protein, partial [Phycisphaerales bacterium]